MKKKLLATLFILMLFCSTVSAADNPIELELELSSGDRSYSISDSGSFSLTYDGSQYFIRVTDPTDTTTGNLTGAEIKITYSRTGENQGSNQNLPQNAGSYMATVFLTHTATEGSHRYTLPGYVGDIEETISVSYYFTIAPKPVILAYDIDTFVYTGEARSPVLALHDEEKNPCTVPFTKEYYEIAETVLNADEIPTILEENYKKLTGPPVEAGTYQVRATLGSSNYCWITDDTNQCVFTVSKAEVNLSGPDNQSFVYSGNPQKPTLETGWLGEASPELEFQYFNIDETVPLPDIPTNAGKYRETITLKNTRSLYLIVGDSTNVDLEPVTSFTRDFEITPRPVVLQFASELTKEYNGEDQLDAFLLSAQTDFPSGPQQVPIVQNATDAQGEDLYVMVRVELRNDLDLTGVRLIDVGDYVIIPGLEGPQKDNFVLQSSDDTGYPNLQVIIKPREVGITVSSNLTAVYDGQDHYDSFFQLTRVVPGDDVSLARAIIEEYDTTQSVNTLTNAGTYWVNFHALTGKDADNYALPTDKPIESKLVTIDPHELSSIRNNQERLVYNGGNQFGQAFWAVSTVDQNSFIPFCRRTPDYELGDTEQTDALVYISYTELMKNDAGEYVDAVYQDAGEYQHTFTLCGPDSANYRFSNGESTIQYDTVVHQLELTVSLSDGLNFIYGDAVRMDYQILDENGQAVSPDALSVRPIFTRQDALSGQYEIPSDVGIYTVQFELMESDQTNYFLLNSLFSLTILPKPISLQAEDQVIDCLPGTNELLAFRLPMLGELGILNDDIADEAVHQVVRYRELGTQDYTTDPPFTIGVYEVEVSLAGERADQYDAQPVYATLIVQVTANHVGPEGVRLYMIPSKAYRLGGEGARWKLQSEPGGITYSGSITFYLNPSVTAGDFTLILDAPPAALPAPAE